MDLLRSKKELPTSLPCRSPSPSPVSGSMGGELVSGIVVCLHANAHSYSTHDIPHVPFRQFTNLSYLCGLDEEPLEDFVLRENVPGGVSPSSSSSSSSAYPTESSSNIHPQPAQPLLSRAPNRVFANHVPPSMSGQSLKETKTAASIRSSLDTSCAAQCTMACLTILPFHVDLSSSSFSSCGYNHHHHRVNDKTKSEREEEETTMAPYLPRCFVDVFVPPSDPTVEQWYGPRGGVVGAYARYFEGSVKGNEKRTQRSGSTYTAQIPIWVSSAGRVVHVPVEVTERCYPNDCNVVLQRVEQRWTQCADRAVALMVSTSQDVVGVSRPTSPPSSKRQVVLPSLYFDGSVLPKQPIPQSSCGLPLYLWASAPPPPSPRRSEATEPIQDDTSSDVNQTGQRNALSSSTATRHSCFGLVPHAVGALWTMLLHFQHLVSTIDPSVAVLSRYQLNDGLRTQLGVAAAPSPSPVDHDKSCLVHTSLCTLPQRESTITPSPQKTIQAIKMVKSMEHVFWRLRFTKSPEEAARFLRSGFATEDAFRYALSISPSTTSEKRIELALATGPYLRSENLAKHKCRTEEEEGERFFLSYPPVCGTGPRATILHYTENHAHGKPGDFVLVDAGISHTSMLYPCDCTRTWPLGHWSPASAFGRLPEQPLLYEALLRVQRKLLQEVRCGVPEQALQPQMCRWMFQELCAVALSCNKDDNRMQREADLKNTSGDVVGGEELHCEVCEEWIQSHVCPHTYGHWFGFDIHERGVARPASSAASNSGGPLSSAAVFGPGSMHTVEPGFYFPVVASRLTESSKSPLLDRCENRCGALLRELSSTCQGIGMRIEDVVLVLPPPSPNSRSTLSFPEQEYASREAYLDRLLEEWKRRHRALEEGGVLSPPVRPQTTLEDNGWDCPWKQSFVETQRKALFGTTAALTNAPVEGGGVVGGGWYPFDVVVITATVPKDVNDVLCAMR